MRMIFLQVLFIVSFVTIAHAHVPKESDIWVNFGSMAGILVGTDGEMNSGFGLVAEGDDSEKGGLELGIYYMKKCYFADVGGYRALEQMKRMQVTMGYKRWFQPKFGVGFSFGTGYSMGDVVTLESKGAPPTNYDSFAKITAEYTLRLAFDYEAVSFEKSALSISPFYDYSLHNRPGINADMAGILFSYKSLIKEKDESERKREAIEQQEKLQDKTESISKPTIN